MTTTLEWPEILLRLALTVIGGALIGLNRERGHSAGLRTTILVCLAASVSMIQVNLLLNIVGKAGNSFVVLDLMRLPLGILTGVGFIGGGAILKKENLVLGVTTAATLWFVTVMGLCFGAGLLGLGLASLVIALVTLCLLKQVEKRLKEERRATLKLIVTSEGPSNADLKQLFEKEALRILSWGLIEMQNEGRREIHLAVKRTVDGSKADPPPLLDQLIQLPGVVKMEWQDLAG